MDDRCYGCGAQNISYVINDQFRAFAYPQTSRGRIAFCNVCFDEARFRDLTAEDIDVLSWNFGETYAEHDPRRAVSLLEPLLEKWMRSAEVLSPLGRAYIALGRTPEGRLLLAEALAAWPNHPNATGDRRLLGDG